MTKSILIGTYTTGDSKGIYQLDLDLETKEVTSQLACEIENPTYIVASDNKKHIYSIAKKNSKGGIASFSIDSSRKLSLQNTYLENGKYPCHITVNKSQTLLFAAYYHQGKLQMFTLLPDGSIGELKSELFFTGSGPNEIRQDKSHLHFVGLTPDEKFLLVTDLGTDKVSVYKIEEEELTLAHIYLSKPGSGPRHLTFHPNGKFIYLFTELSSEVIVLELNHNNGELKEVQVSNSLPDKFKDENTGSAIRITPEGKFLYVANRGFNSLTSYSIDERDGTLTFIQHTSTEGEHPRDFNIDSTGSILVVANMLTNNLVIFDINKNGGELTKLEIDIQIPTPVSIEFI